MTGNPVVGKSLQGWQLPLDASESGQLAGKDGSTLQRGSCWAPARQPFILLVLQESPRCPLLQVALPECPSYCTPIHAVAGNSGSVFRSQANTLSFLISAPTLLLAWGGGRELDNEKSRSPHVLFLLP